MLLCSIVVYVTSLTFLDMLLRAIPLKKQEGEEILRDPLEPPGQKRVFSLPPRPLGHKTDFFHPPRTCFFL